MRRGFLYYSLWALALAVGLPVAAFFLLGLYWHAYFSWHWESEATREAVYAEAQALMRAAPDKDLIRMPPLPGENSSDIYEPKHVPGAMEALKPQSVVVVPRGVYVMTRAAFAEQSGYFIARDTKHFDPHRDKFGSYDPLGDGVWWYHLF